MSKGTLSVEHSAENTTKKIEAQEIRIERSGDLVYAGEYDYLFPRKMARIKAEASKKVD